MESVKLAVIYYSATGANRQMSEWVAEAAEKAGATVRRKKIAETAPQQAIEGNEAWKKFVEESKDEETAELDDLEWADAYIFCTPTRYGNLPSQVQAFFDTTGGLWANGKFVNKVASGTSSAMNPHGGQESTVQAMYKTFSHWGCIIVPPAYSAPEIFEAGGNPYGTSATVDGSGGIQNADKIKAAVEKQTERTLQVAKWVVEGK